MANINKIRVSGTTYDIQDINAPKVIELTQSEYDALTTKDPNAFYVITNAQAGDLTNYYTKTETDNAITAATSTKQDTLVSGTNIKTINNESILGSGNIDIQGGGGKAIEAGRGISVTTGETADTVSFNLPISAGTGTNSVIEGSTYNFAKGNYAHAEGSNTKARGQYSHAEGYLSEASGEGSHAEGTSTSSKNYSHGEGNATFAVGNYAHAEGDGTTAATESSHAEGRYTVTKNNAEHASGQYNNSVSASTTFGDSGNTLFSVGNGTSSSARHNAFEIRQNGDIYLSSGGTDIKLQDHLGGGGSSYSAGDGIDITNDVISVTGKVDTTDFNTYSGTVESRLSEDEEVTAAGLNALNDAVSGKQDTLVSSINIKTINNESLLGSGNIDIQGGGKAIEAGRGISITTGETADTVSFSLPISAGTSSYSIAEGYKTIASFYYSHAEGNRTEAKGEASHAEGLGSEATGETAHAEGYYTHAWGNHSHAEGYDTIAKNEAEHASGRYNVSNIANTTWGDSGNTLFSVGNGTANDARHNAFEIRQNGDIYLTKDGQDVKLQDQLGGGVSESTFSAYTAATDSRLSEDEEVTAAALNTLNDALGGMKLVKLTQTEYDNLSTKDSNTLYVING